MSAIDDKKHLPIELNQSSPKWQRFDYLETVYGLRKDYTLKLINAGLVRSSLIKLEGSTRGGRVIDLTSVERLLEQNANF